MPEEEIKFKGTIIEFLEALAKHGSLVDGALESMEIEQGLKEGELQEKVIASLEKLIAKIRD